jgi:hypothetical protein
MDPGDATDETLTPSLHAEDITVDDVPVEAEDEDEVSSIDESALGEFTPFSDTSVNKGKRKGRSQQSRPGKY